MPPPRPETDSPRPALEAFLLGQVDFDVALALQQRLVEQSRDRDDGQVALLLCEHPTLITVGRGGSPGDVAMQSNLVRNRQIEVRWVNRGGGCLMHSPGQLAIYPIVPLRWHGFSIGEFLHRFQTGIIEAARRPERAEPRNGDGGGFRQYTSRRRKIVGENLLRPLSNRRLGPHRPVGRPRRGSSPLDHVLRRIPERLSTDGPVSPRPKRSARPKAHELSGGRALRPR